MRPEDEDDESGPGCVERRAELAARRVTVHPVSTGIGEKSSRRQKIRPQLAGRTPGRSSVRTRIPARSAPAGCPGTSPSLGPARAERKAWLGQSSGLVLPSELRAVTLQ